MKHHIIFYNDLFTKQKLNETISSIFSMLKLKQNDLI